MRLIAYDTFPLQGLSRRGPSRHRDDCLYKSHFPKKKKKKTENTIISQSLYET